MAPLKLVNKPPLGANIILPTKGVSTRSRHGLCPANGNKDTVKVVGKRKAASPIKETTAKRAAFGDITNSISKAFMSDKHKNILVKKVTVEAKHLPTLKTIKQKYQENIPPLVAKVTKTQRNSVKPLAVAEVIHKNPTTREPLKPIQSQTAKTVKTVEGVEAPKNGPKSNKSSSSTWRLSDEFSEASLYVSALEDVSNDSKVASSTSIKSDKEITSRKESNSLSIVQEEVSCIPDGVKDFDKANWNDPFQVSHYAMDIFDYLKKREVCFPIVDYMPLQKTLTGGMRALLVDWMVEVQESFELNHETLYLAVKLVDTYLCKELTSKEELQLLGAASLFIAAKFDERMPPLIDDFLYICDGAYSLRQLLTMEINVLKIIGFDLGIPLSYRFLRRYARCACVSMPTLTLARFILELCLMEYAVVSLSDSKMAAAALYLAIKMKNLGTWTQTHVYYTGYTLEEILPIARLQNMCLHKKPKEALSTVRNKYSHKIFFEVAKVPLISNEDINK